MAEALLYDRFASCQPAATSPPALSVERFAHGAGLGPLDLDLSALGLDRPMETLDLSAQPEEPLTVELRLPELGIAQQQGVGSADLGSQFIQRRSARQITVGAELG